MEIIGAIVEAIVSAIAGMIEALVSLLAGSAETLSIGEALVALVALMLEFVVWFGLWVIALAGALIHWRRPVRVARPQFWKRKAKSEAPSPGEIKE